MERKLFLIACITFLLIATRCLPTSAGEENIDIEGTAYLTSATTKTPSMEATVSPTSVRDGGSEIEIRTSPTSGHDVDSGIEGTTSSFTVSGVPGGATTGGPASIEFAIAPVAAGSTIYEKAMFLKSDAQGKFRVELPPGTYWIGPKEKALDPNRYDPGAVVFTEMVVEVKAGSFVPVEVVVTGYAP